MAADRPNVLWICTDQQRFDAVGCYGNDYVQTPAIDRIAEQGVRFERCYSQSPVCTPARAAMLTGRYPRTTRCRQNGQPIPRDETLVTRRLAEAGYVCGLSGKLHISPAHTDQDGTVPLVERRIEDGYTEFHWSHGSSHTSPANEYHQWLRERGTEYSCQPYEDSAYVETSMPARHHQTTWCGQKAIEFVERMSDREEPWLFSVNPFDPHPPFDPPEAYLERYLDDLDAIPLPTHVEGEREDKPPVQPLVESDERFPFDEMTARDHRLVRAAYWAMCDLIDDAVGQILHALDRTGQREDTLVVFTSDHGTMLGDHGVYLKGPYFYEPAVRVPLVISGPGVQSGPPVEALVELVDLSPTLTEAAGADPIPGVQGRSLWPVITGERDRDLHRSAVYSEYYNAVERPETYEKLRGTGDAAFNTPYQRTDVWPGLHEAVPDEELTLPFATMIRTDSHKLVTFHGTDAGELYDLESDPTETTNLWNDPEYTATKADLLERLADGMAATVDPLPQRTGRY